MWYVQVIRNQLQILVLDYILLSFHLFQRSDSISLQEMLLHSSLQLPPHVLVIPSPSDVMLLETGMGSPSGEWVVAVSVCWHIAQQMSIVNVDLTWPSQQGLELGLEQQMLLCSLQH